MHFFIEQPCNVSNQFNTLLEMVGDEKQCKRHGVREDTTCGETCWEERMQAPCLVGHLVSERNAQADPTTRTSHAKLNSRERQPTTRERNGKSN